MVRESRLHPDDLIAPLFVKEGIDRPLPIDSLPGQMQHTRETLRREVTELVRHDASWMVRVRSGVVLGHTRCGPTPVKPAASSDHHSV